MAKLTNILQEITIKHIDKRQLWLELIKLAAKDEEYYYILKDFVDHKTENKPWEDFYNEHDGLFNRNVEINKKYKNLYISLKSDDIKIFVAEDTDTGDELDITEYKHMISFGTGYSSADIFLTKF